MTPSYFKPAETSQHLNELAHKIHDNARAKGFWDGERNMGEMLMLAVSELAEALEEHRAGRPNVYYPAFFSPMPLMSVDHNEDGCPVVEFQGNTVPVKPEGTAVELVDCVIRCLDTLASMGVDIDLLVSEKLAYNATRPALHGKAY